MYAVLGRVENFKSYPQRDFAVFLSLLERKFSCSASSAICSITTSPNQTHFAVISNDANICSQVVDFSQKYFNSLSVSPNVTLELVTSPHF